MRAKDSVQQGGERDGTDQRLSKTGYDIICEVGGKENIVNATRCATRLRLVLKEEPEQAKEKVAAMAGVITVVENSGQLGCNQDSCGRGI